MDTEEGGAVRTVAFLRTPTPYSMHVGGRAVEKV
jgi:hypothetical protein